MGIATFAILMHPWFGPCQRGQTMDVSGGKWIGSPPFISHKVGPYRSIHGIITPINGIITPINGLINA